MPTPSLAFAGTLQDEKRLPRGLAFGDVLDEVIRCIPFIRMEGAGESITVPRVVGTAAITPLADWRAGGGAPTTGTPTDSSFQFNFRRLDSLGEDDVTLALANRAPNDVEQADVQARPTHRVGDVAIARLTTPNRAPRDVGEADVQGRPTRSVRDVATARLTTPNRAPNDVEQADWDARNTGIVRDIATALMQGNDNDTTGFLGWENMAAGTNRTDVTKGAATAAGVLESVLQIDDACTSNRLGDRASAYVTTALGRRNIERSAQTNGFELRTGKCKGLPNEVPYIRGRPILVSSGLSDDPGPPAEAPLYAVDFSYVFMVATTGSPEGFCVETIGLPLQETNASRGRYQWFHGACVVRHPTALVRTLITTTVSA